MRCYVHQNTDAIGVCSTCGRGVCNACVVKIGGKFYCKQDANRVFGRNKAQLSKNAEPERGAVLTAGSILTYLMGGGAVLLSCVVLFAGILAGSLSGGGLFSSLFEPDISFLGPVLNYTQVTIILIGLGVMVFGSMGIAAGFYLWKTAVGGTIVAIVFGVLGLVVGFALSSLSVGSTLVDAWFVANALVIALALVGLRQLWFRPIRGAAPAPPSRPAPKHRPPDRTSGPDSQS
ncbi:MAG: hypothetical protein ABSF83_04955 [Nitrososphaerales archaeon]|jgi:hypothetical protein